LAKKTKDPSAMDINRVGSYGRSRKNKYSYSMPDLAGKVCTMQLICYEGGQGE